MRLGIAGAGMIVHHLLSFLDEVKGIEKTAIYARDNHEDRLGVLCRDYHIEKYYVNYDEMLNDVEIDTIYIGVNNHLHYEFTKKAILAGKHVICEKPFTVTLQEFEELYALAKEKHVLLLEAITNLYLPNYLSMKEKIGELGNIRIVHCNYSQYSSRYDDFKKGIVKPCFDRKMAGGALMDLNVYNIHFVIGMFGAPEAVYYYPNMERGVDVSGILIMKYREFQCVCIAAKDCSAPVCSDIQGDEGCIHMEAPTNTCEQFQVILNKKEPVTYQKNGNHHRMYHEFVAFEEMIRTKDYEMAEKMLQQSREVMKVLEEAQNTMASLQ